MTASAGRRGIGDALPLVVSYLPFGLILGATITQSDVDRAAGLASSPLVFAGASQLALIDLLDAGAAAVVVVATALVINLRHVMYSAGMAAWFRGEPAWWQVAAPHLLTDPQYAFAIVRFPELEDGAARRRYYAGLGITLLAAWTAMTAAGMLLGAAIPPSWNLDLAVPLVFLALLMPTVTDRPTAAAAVVGGVVAVIAHDAPLHLGLIIAATAGVAAGMLLDARGGADERA